MVFRFRIFYFIFTPPGLERWLAAFLSLLWFYFIFSSILFCIFLIVVDVIFISFYWIEFARALTFDGWQWRVTFYSTRCVWVCLQSHQCSLSHHFFSRRSCRRRLRAQPIARQPNQRQTVLAQFRSNRRFIHFTQQPKNNVFSLSLRLLFAR